MTADPELPVPPDLYGGVERVVHLLVEELHARGHDVTLFAHPQSRVSCRLVAYPNRSSRSKSDTVRNAAAVAWHIAREGCDVIHSFGRLAYLAPLAFSTTPKIMSYQRAITPRSVRLATRLWGDSVEFTACGDHMIERVRALATWHVVANGVRTDAYTFRPAVDADAPLMFLGRIEEIKGPHLAIDVARRSGRRLVIAGNVVAEHADFFERAIRPYIDGSLIRYVGPVDDAQKNELLGRAAALLMPILWDEPFGIVMAEALACGTPVVGFDRASIPEVIDHDVTGFIVADIDGMTSAISRLDRIDRAACRAAAEARFSTRVIADRYEAIYYSKTRNAREPVAAAEPS